MMSAILNLAILDSAILVFPLKISHTCQDWFPPYADKKSSLIHSDSAWLWQPSWILPSWIQPFYTKLWLKLIQSDANSFILTQVDDVSHLEFCLLDLTILNKKTSLIHSDSTGGWKPSWILPCWIQTLLSWIQTPCYLLWDTLKTLSLHSDSDSN